VALVFDLLGFGAAQSRVVLSAIQLVSDPAANDDAISLDEDTIATGNVLANDVAVGAPIVAVELLTPPAHGVVTLAQDGAFAYRPAANYNGADSFSYRFVDGDGRTTSAATVRLTVRPVNDAPTAPANVTATVRAGELFTFDPRAGAVDVEGSPLVAQIVVAPAHGTVELNADGTYSYLPQRSFAGTDSFTFRVSDGTLGSPTATATFTVLAATSPPVARDVVVELLEDGRVRIDPRSLGIGTAGEEVASVVLAGPAHGSLVVESDGRWLYTPSADFNGSDAVRYQLVEAGVRSNEATLTLHVLPVNDAPALADRTLSLPQGSTLVIDPLLGASDVEGDALTAAIVNGPVNGTLVVRADGSFAYTPFARFVGSDSFTFRVDDGHDASRVATVSLTIAAAGGLPPTAVDSLARGTEDTALVLRWADFNVAGGTAPGLTVVVTALPVEGTLQSRQGDGTWRAVVSGDAFGQADLDAGKLRFVPAADAAGGPGFASNGDGNRHAHYARVAFKAFDGTLSSSEAHVVIDIAAVADSPSLRTSTSQPARGNEDTAVTLPGIDAALSDGDGSESLVITLTGLPIGATLGDGVHSAVVTADRLVVDVSGWASARCS
jgi:hypothetical protein